MMLVVQMHLLNIHLTDFGNSVDHYMKQQMQLQTHLYQQQQKQEQALKHREKQDPNNMLLDGDDSDGDLGPILRILGQAGYDISNDQAIQRKSLPSWSKIVDAYGQPTILGLETCERFRDSVDSSLRNLGVAGLFNSGAWKLRILGSYMIFFSRPPRHKSTVWSVERKL
jgi:hypothetical protein